MPRQSLSQKVAGQIRTEINTEELAPGVKLPSEAELCEKYGVSRSTVRSALKQLEAIGIVQSRHGSGTYIKRRLDVQAGLQELDSISESIRSSGRTPGMEYSSVMVRPTLPQESEYMNLAPSENVVEVRRIISGDGVTIAYSYDLIPLKILPVEFRPDDLNGSLFRYFQEKLNLFPHYSSAEIHAVHSKHIGWGPEGAAHELFVKLQQLHYDAAADLLLYSQTYFIEGRYTFTIQRSVS